MPGRVGQHVDAFDLNAQAAQHLDHRGGEAALREDRRALKDRLQQIQAASALNPKRERAIPHASSPGTQARQTWGRAS
jgi:hypothetical protein